MKLQLKHLLIVMTAIGIVSLTFSGCQTTQGVGEDIENLGESIQD